MIIRLRSKDGNFRLEVSGLESFQDFYEMVGKQLNIPWTNIRLSSDPSGRMPISGAPYTSISNLGFKHGDLIFVIFDNPEAIVKPQQPSKAIVEDEIDVLLDKEDGLITRTRDSNFCKHSANGMCDYCMPLEPYDAGYLESKGIKHMSFHSYLRQLHPKHKRKSEAYIAPLEEPCFKITASCTGGHLPWPKGICTKCQPSAITLQRQPFRFVDHVEFASAMVVDGFISSWRANGLQRFGYLLGRYEAYPEVPLGIKAVVEAIYEPPQENFQDELQVQFDEDSERELTDAAKLVNLKILGMIYTDLFDKGEGNGKVLCKRHVHSYFLSSQECVFSAEMQLRYPNPCHYSKSGKYGSKFLTCVISGNQEGDIDIDAYQISNSGMAMVDADIIQPSVQPSKMLVSEETENRYIPEIFYKYKNAYGVTVRQNASPYFPVEYLIVNVTHGFPSQPNPLFISIAPFPIENRPSEHAEIKLLKVLLDCENLPNLLSNFHLLFYLKNSAIISTDELETAVTLATCHNQPAFDKYGTLQKLLQSPGWLTLMTILRDLNSSNDFRTDDRNGTSSGTTETWSCRHCTFHNPILFTECDMCGLPQD